MYRRDDYSNIQDIESLRSARQKLSSEIRVKEMELLDEYRNLKTFINPMTYVHKLITRAYALRHIFTAVQSGVDSVKSFFERFTSKKTPSPAESGSAGDSDMKNAPSVSGSASAGNAEVAGENAQDMKA